MNILEIIEKKANNKKLEKEEIEYFIKEYTNGKITDYQASALVMAIYINGMDDEEITNLTLAMAYSGNVLDLSDLGTVVDKHSTGGVGDKITLILMPIVAALGIPVAKMSGKGLGFTGGTADKLEAIPGYNINLTIEEFKQNVKNIGISIMTQTENLAPADKKIYALRDTISCTNSLPLIASSIMSKKIAAGANKIVLDVTCGSGAFMKNLQDAEKLAIEMKNIGKLANKETVCVITNMNEPLGYAVGNNIEVIEVIRALKGEMPEDVKNVVLELGAYMLKLAGKGENIEKNKIEILETINSGKAFNKFLQLVENQGGDITYIENTDKFEKSKYEIEIFSKENGCIAEINAEQIGKLASYLGAGRIKKEDKIDYTAGIILNKKVGDNILVGEKLATIYTNKEDIVQEAKQKLENIIKISNEKVEKEKVILEII
jgi:pyrimidine-nucleoside phosphorylase